MLQGGLPSDMQSLRKEFPENGIFDEGFCTLKRMTLSRNYAWNSYSLQNIFFRTTFSQEIVLCRRVSYGQGAHRPQEPENKRNRNDNFHDKEV